MSNGKDRAISRADILLWLAFALGLLLLWQFSYVFLLFFAAIVLATPLRAGAKFLESITPLSIGWALLVVILVGVAVLGTFGYLFGTTVHSELVALFERLPEISATVSERWNLPNPLPIVQDYLSNLVVTNGILGSLAGYTSSFVGVMSGLVLMIVSGIFLAADPGTYRRGFLALIPQKHRDKADEALLASGEALRRWLLGQLIAMVIVGIAIGTGLYFIGVESALALGVLAGLLEFIPFLGPILAALPAVLIAMSSDDYTVLYVVGLYFVVQQIENNLLVPLIQRRAADLPPVLGIFAVVALGGALGPMGLLFGTPITVVMIVLVKYLYIRNTLGDAVDIPSIDAAEDGEKSET